MKRLFVFLFLVAGPLFFLADVSADFEKTQHGLFPDEILSADTLYEKIRSKKTLLIFDARDKRSYDSLHIQGAKLPMKPDYYRQMDLFKNGIISEAPDYEKALAEAVKDYPKDIPIVTYCNSGCHAGAVLALRLKQKGLKDVQSMEEGLQEWQKKGYPVQIAK